MPPSGGPLHYPRGMNVERFGPLTVRLAGGADRQGGGGSGPVVVLLHGFGASGSDLVPLWRVLDVPPETRFVFPEALLPLEMGYGDGRAWWPIDFERIERAQRGDPVEALADDLPAGLPAARAAVREMLEVVHERLGGPIVLGGFSQGAMLSCDVALHDPLPLAGLALMSAALIARRQWAPRAASRAGLRVMQSHGSDDPLLPFASAQALRELLMAGGLSVDWVPFRGGHTIPDAALARLGALVTGVVAG